MLCAAHPKIETELQCGRCESAICPRCFVPTPVGTRCRSCAPVTPKRFTASTTLPVVDSMPLGALVAVGLALFLVIGRLAWGNDQFTIVSVILIGALISLSVHEFSHGLVAYLGGDTEIRQRGYLTLNPFRFINCVYSVIMPLIFVLLGGVPFIGGATMIDPRALRSPMWGSLVSLAGPASNVVLAALIGTIFKLGLLDPTTPFAAGLAYLMVIEIGLALFNLIPVPPLDGFGWLAPFLPESLVRQGYALGYGGYFFLILVMWTVPGASSVVWTPAFSIAYALGAPVEAVYVGWAGMSLW